MLPPPTDLNSSMTSTMSINNEKTRTTTIEEERPRKVQFAADQEHEEIESHKSYSQHERLACWYTPREQMSRKSIANVVLARMDADKPELERYPHRGLERWTEKGSFHFQKQVHEVLHSVLDEQDHQWLHTDISDVNKIAFASERLSVVATRQALEIARQDERAAKEIYQDTTTTTSTSSTNMANREAMMKRRRHDSSKTNLGRRIRQKSFDEPTTPIIPEETQESSLSMCKSKRAAAQLILVSCVALWVAKR